MTNAKGRPSEVFALAGASFGGIKGAADCGPAHAEDSLLLGERLTRRSHSRRRWVVPHMPCTPSD